MSKYPYYNWKQAIDARVPENMRIGSDLMIVTGSALQDSISSPRVVDACTFILLDKGESKMLIDMREYALKAPCLAVIMPDKIYQLLEKSEDVSFRAIVMSPSFTDRLLTNAEGHVHSLYASILKNPLISLDNEQDVFGQYYELLLSVARSPKSEFKLDSALHLTLAMFYGYSHMKHEMPDDSKGTTRQEELYSRFLELVGDNYKKSRDIGFYADKLCVTAKYLSGVVKAVSGKTALEVIEDYVLTECKALLLSTSMTIQEVSDELNFPSQSVFGKYFKRLTGLSPKAYRQEQSS